MKAVNLYTISRDTSDDIRKLYIQSLCAKEKIDKVRSEELEMIGAIAQEFLNRNCEKYCFNYWFYSFSIPQIGKEFDLLKIAGKKAVINIELKSQEVPLEKIEKQLVRNRYYLAHISDEIYSFTYVKIDDTTSRVYRYDDELKESSMDELVDSVKKVQEAISEDIEKYFRPKDYLISPFNDTEKFLDGKYYLNVHQEEIKNRILSTYETNLIGISGDAGTGKTLLLYDIARTIAENKKVGIIHSGLLNEGHRLLNEKLNNISIIEAKDLSEEWIGSIDMLCVDETQRLYSTNLDKILDAYKKGNIESCIFSYDYNQVLSKPDLERNIPEKLRELDGYKEIKLTDKIRTSEELYSFIRNLSRLKDKPEKPMEYDDVDVVYANTQEECDRIITFYISEGYKFITYTKSLYTPSKLDHYYSYKEASNSHQVIGQEFDNVIVVMDDYFSYTESGDLHAKVHPYRDYLFEKMFYQNITRARQKLCIVVLGNEDVFEKLVRIKENCLE
ncbi:MAG: DUF2075 domain-containing protein [Butyrivibrio sp.]|nr:DUF2075 domain-containing protein [Butyrivibrio sp.]